MKLSKFVTALGVTMTLVTVSILDLPNPKQQEAQAQTTGRPYVVFVNGYQDSCAWGRYANGSPAPSDEYLQTQMANKIQQVLVNVTPSSQTVASNTNYQQFRL